MEYKTIWNGNGPFEILSLIKHISFLPFTNWQLLTDCQTGEFGFEKSDWRFVGKSVLIQNPNMRNMKKD
jgi:hypothetical protein